MQMSGKTVGEVVGFTGVVASLLFVGLQLRQATQVARAEAYRGVSEQLAQWYYTSLGDEDLALALRGITYDELRRDDLTDAQKWAVGSMMLVLVRGLESVYLQVEDGVLPEASLRLYNMPAFREPYMKDLWPLIVGELDPDFATYFQGRFLGSAP
jgi:hypothetical protein